jgi:phage host-nuclease inhibitor protein Gam
MVKITSDLEVDEILKRLSEIDSTIMHYQHAIDAQRKTREEILAAHARALHDYCYPKLATSKTKTLKFPHGTVSWRVQKSALRVTDTEAALEYLRNSPALWERCVVMTPRLKSTEYVAVAEEAGERLPGIEEVPERELFYILGERIDLPPADKTEDAR